MKITFTLIAIVAGMILVNPFGADTIHQEGQVQANGITITYESFGKPDRETILLIGGTGMQLTDWPTEFCEELVSWGCRVVIYDNRDIGLSSKFDGAGVPDFAAVIQAAVAGKPAALPYTLYDMANDAVSLLDALGIKKAHIVGKTARGLHPDILIRLERESKGVKCFLKILRGKHDWWPVGSRIVRLTLSFGRSREMRTSLRLPGKWLN